MKEYKVLIGGLEHTLVLSEDDARRYGVWVDVKAVKTVPNKAAAPKTKG